MRQITLLLHIILPFIGYNQNITVTGKIFDYENNTISAVKIIYGNSIDSYTNSRIDGTYSIKIDISKLKIIKFEHIAFQNKSIIITNKFLKRIKNDTFLLDVQLNDIELGIIEVGAKKPKIIFKSKVFSVADYESLPNGNLILLSYDKTLKKGSKIKLIDGDMKELDSYITQDECIELITDFRNNIHLITKNNIYQIIIINNRIYLYKEDASYFYKYISPIVDTLQDRIYYSNYSEIYPAFDYMEFNITDSIYKKILKVEDAPLMEEYRAEFRFSDVRTKLWAHRKEIETGIDKEVWVGASIFSKSLYYTPLYAPLFIKNDSVLVFDHYNNKLYKYTPLHSLVDSIDIDYHLKSRKSGWEHPLIQDENNKNIYAIFMRNGFTFLSLLNTNTGGIIKTKKLFYKYIEKIQIVDDEVYYIYRPFETIQNKYIYKESIK